MARTFSGLIFYGASQLNFTAVAPATDTIYTRNAKGDVSYNQIASKTCQYQMGLADLKRPYFTFPYSPGQGTVPTSNEFQHAFGTAAGGPSNPFSGGLTGT